MSKTPEPMMIIKFATVIAVLSFPFFAAYIWLWSQNLSFALLFFNYFNKKQIKKN